MAHNYANVDIQFINNLPKKYICSECQTLLKKPMILNCCGKLACESCIEDPYEQRVTYECRICGLYDTEATYDDELWEEILLLEVRCPLFYLGCPWTGKLKSRGSHVDPNQGSCDYISSACTNGCGEKLTKAELSNHINKLCPKRQTVCKHCYEAGTFDIINGEHRTECSVECIGDNLAFLKYTDVFEYIQDCTCPLCNKVMRKPLQVECCDKHYCASCIQDPYTEEEKYNCPNCNKNDTFAFIDIQLYMKIFSLLVLCPFSNNGCNWKGPLRKAGVHTTKHCDYFDIECPNKCGKKLKRCNLEDHLTECLYTVPPDIARISDSTCSSGTDDDEYHSLCEWLPDKSEHETAINLTKPVFVYPALQEYICLKCLDVMESPMLTECCSEHFCARCLLNQNDMIEDTYEYFSYICPSCNKATQALLDNEKWTSILKLDVKCPFKDCSWIGELKSMRVHSAECTFADVVCRNECGEKLPRCKLAEHMGIYCSMRQTICQYCNKPGEFKIINGSHIDDCPDYPLPCPNNCDIVLIKQQFLKQHLLDCPEMLINCDFECIGCNQQIKQKDILKHAKESAQYHLDLQNKFFKLELDKRDHQIENMVKEKNEQIEYLHQLHDQQLSNLIVEKQKQEAISLQNSERILSDLREKYERLEMNTLQILACSIDKIDAISLVESASIGQGTYQGKEVLIKKYSPATGTIFHLQEVTTLMKLKHPNIIELHGIITTTTPMYIILEYMTNGNLEKFLKLKLLESMLLDQQIAMCQQIANAMSYVHTQLCMHGKIQATSVYMGEAFTCKLGDFSSSIFLEYYTQEIDYQVSENDSELLPPEVIKHKKRGLKSDVWSFGLLIWEIAINSHQNPYQGLSAAKNQILTGNALEQPLGCPEELYCIIVDCMKIDPLTRLTFEAITDLLDHVKDTYKYAEIF